MNRRVISVPKDEETRIALDTDSAEQERLIKLYITDVEFNFLLSTGLLEKINQECFCNIGDYESDEVVGQDSVKSLISVLDKMVEDDTNLNIILKIKNLASEALSRNTGIYFFF